jgi:hypothetical protein
MTRRIGFRIRYQNSHLPVPAPETYEGYDVVSAFYDYLPAGARATISIDEYALDLTGLLFVNWVRESLPLAEQIRSDGADQSDYLRKFLPNLPPDARIYFWIAADIAMHAPILVFAVDGDSVLIYTRTDANVSGPLLIVSGQDREEPTVVPRALVIEEIRSCLTKYLDDLAIALPFLREDELYRQYRARLAALV